MDDHMMAAEIAALKNEIETLKGQLARQVEITEYAKAITAESIAQERAQVVQEVREYVHAWAGYSPGVGTQVSASLMMKKLDSMEPDKGDGE